MNEAQRKTVRDRLSEIADANDGRLTPDDVLADARSKKSPLHEFFEWNVDKAAHSHWIEQARQLITSVRVVVHTDKVRVGSVVCYVRDPSAEHQQQGYVSVARLRTDADLSREALVSEFSRVADLLRRAREIAAALDASTEVESLLQSVLGLRQRFMDPPEARQ